MLKAIDMNKKYKLSQYNVYHREGDTEYIWNTYSGALLSLDETSQKYIRDFVGYDDGSCSFNLLKANGFIVSEQLDEFGQVCMQEKQELFKQNPEKLSYVIAPGMKCNYSCKYCFESQSDLSGEMTIEIADAVVNYICNELSANGSIKTLVIKWFGGEPLLYVDIIDYITKLLQKYTEENNIVYYSHIVTNGRFLDAINLERIMKSNVTVAQISVDGMRESYIKNKGAAYEDFDIVISNIVRASEVIDIQIRLNIPKDNAYEALLLTKYLLEECGLLGKVKVWFAHINDYTLSKEEAYISLMNYADNYYQWMDYMLQHYGKSSIDFLSIKRIITSCGLIKFRNTCIGSRGELYKCEHNFGIDEMVTGNVWQQGTFFNSKERSFYCTVDDQSKENCQNCEYTPVCMGGCANDRIGGYFRPDCMQFKHFLLKQKLLEGGVHI